MKTATVSQRLDRLPILPFHKRILMLVGAGLFFDAFDIYLANSVLGALLQDGWSTVDKNAAFLSATAFGMLLGSVMAGILGDRYGRKFTYQFNLLVFGLSSIACAFMPTMEWLIVARFVTGIGLGAELVIGYGLLSEFVPPSHRGRWAALLSCIAQFGLFAATLTSWIVIPSLGWRAMFIIAGIGGLIVFIARKNIPESPRWLERNGKQAEADAIVTKIESETNVGTLAPIALSQQSALMGRINPLAARFHKPLAIGAVTQIVQSAAIYGFIALLPTFLAKQGIPINKSLGQSVLMTFGGPAGALAAYFLTDRIGRKPAIIGASILGAIIGPCFALVQSQEIATALGFLMFGLVYFLVSVVQAGYLPELFPTEVRMRLTSWAVTAGRLTSIGIPFVSVYLVQAGGLVAVVGTVAALLVVQALMIATLAVETNRKSLEEIDADTLDGSSAETAAQRKAI
ncbi:putative MFS transporter [Agrobacterium pusense]|uniref:MFS transporter n=1 Tax=Agrobacterium pusense TaxID=648995 RepID=UPI0028668A8E|nr:MFS transporter [Agrobacterium pusense]MDR6192531.1 putative MFS transporter [Agrobacterium pusense]